MLIFPLRRERGRKRERETDRQTDRQRQRQIDRQTEAKCFTEKRAVYFSQYLVHKFVPLNEVVKLDKTLIRINNVLNNSKHFPAANRIELVENATIFAKCMSRSYYKSLVGRDWAMMCCDLYTARDVELGMQTDWFDYRFVMHNIMSGQYWSVSYIIIGYIF